jgi:hypothetical protein
MPMTYEIKDFIGRFDNAFEPQFCKDAIRYYEAMAKKGFGGSRQKYEPGMPATIKETDSLFLSAQIKMNHAPDFPDYIMHVLWENCYKLYHDKYASLETVDSQNVYEMKMQKTPIGGGYHVWHWESSGRATSNRLLNYQIFLNDVDEGGETEFLYLHRREKAKEGTLLIYPGNFTHTHRGNPPISNEKYIINGWIEF